MLPPRRFPRGTLALCGLALAACADGAPTSPGANRPSLVDVQTPAPVCQTITFDEFARGDYVTSVTLGALNLSVTATAYSNINGEVADQARAFDTDHVSLSNNDGTDMEHAGTFARCPACDGLGRILVVDRLGTTAVLDNNPGGTLTLSGFAGSSNLYVNSFTSIDNDLDEPGTILLVDGVQVAQSTPLGDGAVETVNAALTPTITDNIKFVIGTVTKNDGNASRGVDNIEICTRPTPLGCTRTIGYWKTHAGFGPQDDVVSALLPIWLGTPGGASSVQVTTALQAVNILNLSGGASNGIVKLQAQLLGAKLNVAAGADGSSVSGTIAAADAFLATHGPGSWAGLSDAQKTQVLAWKDDLDEYNNGLNGPPHCD